MADPERPADAPRILNLPGAAALCPSPFRRGYPEAHRHADRLMTALLEQQGRHGGIDAAAHGNRHLLHAGFFPS